MKSAIDNISDMRSIFYCIGFAISVICPSVHAADRPNILWLTAEDISPLLGCFGDSYSVTPNLDRLAEQGVRYTRCYANIGVCAPARSCLITGVYPTRLGSHRMRCTTRVPEQIVCFSKLLRDAGYYCTNNAKTDYNFRITPGAWDENSRTAHYRNRKAGQPFFAVFNHEVTHQSQVFPTPAGQPRRGGRIAADQRHDPAKALLPPFHPDLPEVRSEWAHYYDNITVMDQQIGEKLKELEAAGLAEDTIVFFFGDNGTGMPGIKQHVWEAGLHVPLIVRVPEKFKHLCAVPKGQATDPLVSFVDFAPTVLSLVGVEAPNYLHGGAFLGPRAGEPRRYIYGHRDRMAERDDMTRVVRDARFIYLRNFRPDLPWGQYLSYTHQMKTMQAWQRLAEEKKLTGPQAFYFASTKPVEELYDAEKDPWCTKNLAGDPSYGAELRRLRGECIDWMRRTHDLGFLPEYEQETRSRGSTPWEIAADPAKNPLDELLKAAEVANRTDPANVPQLARLLSHADSAVRYWGAVGLCAIGKGAAPAKEELKRAMTDASPVVQIAAAEALLKLGDDPQALGLLTGMLKHESPMVRLPAICALDRLGAKSAIAAIRAAASAEKDHVSDYFNRMVEYLPGQLESGSRLR